MTKRRKKVPLGTRKRLLVLRVEPPLEPRRRLQLLTGAVCRHHRQRLEGVCRRRQLSTWEVGVSRHLRQPQGSHLLRQRVVASHRHRQRDSFPLLRDDEASVRWGRCA